MSRFFRIFLVVGCALFSYIILAENRVEKMRATECAVVGDHARGKCPKINKRLQDEGCITEEERISLDKRTWVATCDDGVIVTVCSCSCFDPSMRVLVKNQKTGLVDYVAIKDLPVEGGGYRIQAVSDKSIVSLPFKIAACDVGEVLAIELQNDSVLKVTAEHPVLLASGKMVKARELVLGDQLLNQLHEPIQIKSIHQEMSSGEVLNILVDEENLKTPHVIIAEGLLVGDAHWQRVLLGVDDEQP